MIKKYISSKINPVLHIILGYTYDTIKFLISSSSFFKDKDKSKLTSYLLKQSHGVEKAMTLPKPKQGRGYILVNHLIENTKIYYEKYGYDKSVKISLDNLLEISIHRFINTHFMFKTVVLLKVHNLR